MLQPTDKFQWVDYFDVWGNKKDGYEVNNLARTELYLSFTEDEEESSYKTRKKCVEALEANGYLITSDLRRLTVDDISGCGDMIEVFEKKSRCPLGRWERVYE